MFKKYHVKFLLFLLSVAFAVYLSNEESIQSFLLNLGNLGYIGAFFAGILFVWIFTMPTGLLIFLTLSSYLTPWEIALIGGAGAMTGDYLIFKFVKDDLASDVSRLYKKYGRDHLSHVLRSKYFHWTFPFIGALIIASPFPDEIGVSLMGISRMGTYKFVAISYILNTLGILAVVEAGELIRSL